MNAASEVNLQSRIRSLQTHLRTHSNSPLFARLADLYLDCGDPDHALQVSLEGLKSFPDYSSAHLMLAKSYLMLRRYHDARESLKKVLYLLPVSSAAYELEKKSYELERLYPPAKKTDFEIAIPGAWSGGQPSRRKKWSQHENLIPGAQLFIKSNPKLQEAIDVPEVEIKEEIDLEALAEKLENAKIPVVAEDTTHLSFISPQIAEQSEVDSRPVTETLASIYAHQGRYLEAIRSYEILKVRFPDRSAAFDEIIDRLRTSLKNFSSK